ncbi:unnamed protein product [Polarella glacialis]|uniref:Uncharacterized protein n=1 Tax=Polarella glacialis TaxID=89957 RepID=A0A813LC88_POLGL|nr:unnamed protein product [Polarella glacialis]
MALNYVAGAVADDACRTVGNAIGKPLDGLTSNRTPGHSEINWVEFNYPPLIRLIHFRLHELPSSLTGIIRCFNISFLLTVFTCFISFVNTLIIVTSMGEPIRWLLQSAIHLIVLPVVALGVFYSGYRGLAEPDSSLAWRFKVGQPILAFAYLLLGTVPWGSVNGLAKLGSTNGSVYWLVVIILESTLWLGNCGLAVLNSVASVRFDSYGGSMASPGNRF